MSSSSRQFVNVDLVALKQLNLVSNAWKESYNLKVWIVHICLPIVFQYSIIVLVLESPKRLKSYSKKAGHWEKKGLFLTCDSILMLRQFRF